MISLSSGLCYAVIFGQVTAIVQQSQKKSESYHQTLDNMRSFCQLYNVPKEISTRIIDYYMYTWVLNRGVDTNQVSVFWYTSCLTSTNLIRMRYLKKMVCNNDQT